MGHFALSVFARGVAPDHFHAQVEKHCRRPGVPVYVTPEPVNGWLTAYPSLDLVDSVLESDLGEDLDAEHVLIILLIDSDVFHYWYIRGGKTVDSFVSCPDYFGDSDQSALDAAGDPEVFTDLVGSDGVAKLRELLKARMINGEEVGGPTPVFEEERIQEFGQILGLSGVLGSFNTIEAGESGGDFPDPKSLVRID